MLQAGLSGPYPVDVQMKILRSVKGLENVRMHVFIYMCVLMMFCQFHDYRTYVIYHTVLVYVCMCTLSVSLFRQLSPSIHPPICCTSISMTLCCLV